MNTQDVVDVAVKYGTAYGSEEIRVMADAMLTYLPVRATIVEIGCQYGCSTSAILTMAKERGHRVYCVDPFTFEETGKQDDVGPKFLRSMLTFEVPFAVLAMRSADALQWAPQVIDMVHIDGDHSKEGVEFDCGVWLPRVRPGGLAVCHDYGRCGAPDVKPVVDAHTQGWKVLCTDGLWIGVKP